MYNMIKTGCETLGVSLNEQQINSLISYYDILTERNKSVNLTRITDQNDVVTKHFLDSISPVLTGLVKGNVIDVGTGAGFPGLVLKCVLPEINMTLLDSLNKRVVFLKDAAAAMSITDNINFIHGRAEDTGHDKNYREKFDTVVSRAVANMRTLSEWCLPFVKQGGYFLALKGPLAASELEDARGAIKILGGEVTDVFDVEIPFVNLEHKIIIVKKVRQTPKIFARKGGKSTSIPVEEFIKKSK